MYILHIIYFRDSVICSILCLKDDNCLNFSVHNKTGIWQCLSISDDCLKEQPGILECKKSINLKYNTLVPWAVKNYKNENKEF